VTVHTVEYWLDSGSRYLNSVIGNEELGFPYGRILEIAGWQSNGKTALALDLAATAQEEGAEIVWVDVETSFDEKWSNRRGLKTRCKKKSEEVDAIHLIQPFVGRFGTEKTPRLSTAQELCEEAERVVSALNRRGAKKIVLVIDSVAALLTDDEADAGITDQNMRTAMSLPSFMGKLLRRWIGLFQCYNVAAFLINQIRSGPKMFGNPEYHPAGNALKFYCHSQVEIKRIKGGKLMKGGKCIGVKGILKNIKNKTGGQEFGSCGYKIFYQGSSTFTSAERMQKEGA
jgi:recombination protein RecA